MNDLNGGINMQGSQSLSTASMVTTTALILALAPFASAGAAATMRAPYAAQPFGVTCDAAPAVCDALDSRVEFAGVGKFASADVAVKDATGRRVGAEYYFLDARDHVLSMGVLCAKAALLVPAGSVRLLVDVDIAPGSDACDTSAPAFGTEGEVVARLR